MVLEPTMGHQGRRARRRICATAALLVAALASCARLPGDDDSERLLAGAIVVDTHIDAPFRIERSGEDLSQRTDKGQFDLVRAQEGGLGIAFMSIFVPASEDEAGRGRALADREIDHVEALVARSAGRAALARCVGDARRIVSEGRLALALGMENGGPLAGGDAWLPHFVDRGVRYVTLAHAKSNVFADSSYDAQKQWGGLSPAGEAMVRRLNTAGVMVDVSHLSEDAVWDVLATSAVPVIASHSAARRFTPGFERNLSDEMIRAIAAAGGVVQINFGSSFVTADAQAWEARRQEAFARYRLESGVTMDSPSVTTFMTEYASDHPFPRASLDDVLDHFDHVAALVGTDHVGIGSDFDGVGDTLPAGLEDVTTYPVLAAGLARRGHRRAALDAMLGGNLLRVWAAAERYAAAQGTAPCAGPSADVLNN
jgi:membrane dipeptidase